MLAKAAGPAIATARRTVARAAARIAPSIRDVKYTRLGKIARGSRSLYNNLMNAKYGKPIGRHGMTWSQIADKGYGAGTPGYTAIGGGDTESDE